MTSVSPKVRVRFAPAPSGSLHVGNARSALFNWLFARHHGGTFILRIEDTDRSRVSDEYIEKVKDVLRWLGLPWDEGPDVGGSYEPYRQSERMDTYKDSAEHLLTSGAAFRCYCTPEERKARNDAALKEGKPPPRRDPCRELTDVDVAQNDADAKPWHLRFRVPDEEKETVFEDLILGEIRTAHVDIEDFPMTRSDGSPLYVLAAATDDLAMDVTHIIRGADLVSATPKQILIYRALGRSSWARFAHLPLIVGSNRQPLSKRHGETSVEWYREHGFLPEALVNYLALLGWSAGDGVSERFTLDELVELFSLENVSHNPAAFDVQKLTALNGEKIRALPADDLARRIEPILAREKIIGEPASAEDREIIRKAVPLIQERMKTLEEAMQLRFFFADFEPDEKAAAYLIPRNTDVLEKAFKKLTITDDWTVEAITGVLDTVAEELHLKRKEAFQPVRAAVTFSTVSPPLPESMEILGRERSLGRLREALERSRHAS